MQIPSHLSGIRSVWSSGSFLLLIFIPHILDIHSAYIRIIPQKDSFLNCFFRSSFSGGLPFHAFKWSFVLRFQLIFCSMFSSCLSFSVFRQSSVSCFPAVSGAFSLQNGTREKQISPLRRVLPKMDKQNHRPYWTAVLHTGLCQSSFAHLFQGLQAFRQRGGHSCVQRRGFSWVWRIEN